MEIWFYETTDSGFLSLKGITDKINSLHITRSFLSGDTFTLTLPETPKNYRFAVSDEILEVPGVFSGYVTAVSIGENTSGTGEIVLKGSSFDKLLSRRILISGTSSDSFMTVLEKNAGESAGELRSFPCTYFDKETDCDGMLADGLYYVNMGTYRQTVSNSKMIGLKSEIEHSEEGARVRIYGRYGEDRSAVGNSSNPVVISDAYGNVTDTEYNYNESGGINGAYIYSDVKYNSVGQITCKAWSKTFGSVSGFGRCESVYKIDPAIYYEATAYGESVVWSPVLDKEGTEKKAENYFISHSSSFTDCCTAVLRLKGKSSMGFEVGDKISLYSKRLGRAVHETVYKAQEDYEDGAHYVSVYIGPSD
jgi:hypothetical protein